MHIIMAMLPYRNGIVMAEVAGKLYKSHCMRYFSADDSKDRSRSSSATQLLVELLGTFLLIC